MNRTVTILGGGPAGLALAFYAHRAGLPFLLLEGAPVVGGLCRTFQCGPHRYDAGAHRFHDRDANVTRDVRALGVDLAAVDAPSQILAAGRFLPFPPRPLAWLRGRGIVEGTRVAADLLRARVRSRPERTFEDYAVNRYGRRLAQPLLLDYSAKLWGRPCRELAPEVATRRLSGMTLASLLVETLLPQHASRHLDGTFLYPHLGYGAITDALAASLPPEGIRTTHAVTGFDVARGRVRTVHVAGRAPIPVGDRVVSTLPLPALVRLLGRALPDCAHRAAAALQFRHVRIVFLRLGVPRCTPNATVYLPDPTLVVSRVSEPRNRSASMAPAGETSLVCEVPCSAGDEVYGLDDTTLARRVIAELAGVGLVAPQTVLEWRHHLLGHAYPVYDLQYADRVQEIRDALRMLGNLDVLGRAGAFWYSHLHDQLRAAKDWVWSHHAAGGAPAVPQGLATHDEIGGEAVPRTASA